MAKQLKNEIDVFSVSDKIKTSIIKLVWKRKVKVGNY